MSLPTPGGSPPPAPRRRRHGRIATIGLLVAGLLATSLPGLATAQESAPAPRFPVVRLDVGCDPACTNADIAASNTSRKLAVAPDGTVIATFRATEGIFVTRSSDEGATFGAPVRVTSTSAQPALAVSASGTSYLAWAAGGYAYLAKGDRTGAWSAPVQMGALSGANLQLAVDGDHVYAVNQTGTTLLRSTDGGLTFTTTTVSASSWVYADVHVDPLTSDVYVVVDNPSVSYYRSTDRGATFSPATAVPGAQVYYSVGALTSTPAGPLAYFAGQGTNLERIDLTTGTTTRTTIAASDLQARSLGADAFGNVISGSASGGQLRFEVSQDLGQTFAAPVSLGSGLRANAAINTTVGDVMFLHQTSAGVHLAVYGGLLTGYDVSVDLSAASFGAVGQSRTITVTNTSDEDLPVDTIAVGEDQPFDVAETCGEILAAMTSCTITVTSTGPGSGFLTVDIGGVERSIPLTFAPSDVEEPALAEPTFGDVERTADGFEVAIEDHDDALTYTASSDLGEVTVEDGVVTVTGLEPGETATVTVEVSQEGSTSATSTVTGTALDQLATPTFGAVARTVDGFTATVADHDAEVTYAVATTAGTATIGDDGTITVTGLEAGEEATVTVTTTRDGAVGSSATVVGSALDQLDTPTFGEVERTADGFVLAIDNHDPAQTYEVTTDRGTVTVDEDGIVTVTGLEAGEEATLTVTTTREGAAATSTTFTRQALESQASPTVADVQRTLDGFTVAIDPIDPDATYTVATDHGTATIDGDGVITVSGLEPGQEATVMITVTAEGRVPAEATVTSAALDELPAPVLGDVERTVDGFSFPIEDHDDELGYLVTTDVGTVVIDDAGTVTVTGLEPGEVATVTVTLTRDGAAPRTVTVGGAALEVIAEPTFGAATRTPDGFTVALEGREDATTYEVSSDLGTAVLGEDGTITVTGVEPGATATVTVTASREGAVATTVTVAAAALDALAEPTFGEVRPSRAGLEVAVTNHDATADYAVSATYGTVTISADGVITVTGLAPGASTTITVTVSRDGAVSETVTLVAASATPVPPTDPLPEAGSDQLPILGAGEGSATVDGDEVDVEVTRGTDQAVVTGGGASAVLRFSTTTGPAAGPLQVPSDALVGVEASGLLAGSTVTLWVLGVDVPVGTAVVGDDGVVDLAGLPLPATVTACTRTLQVTGLTADGAPIGLNLGLSIVPNPYPFGDVEDTSTHAANVACAEAHGLIRGFGDGSYLPTDGLRREQFASILARALDLEPTGAGTVFPDTAGSVHEDAVAAVAEAGLIRGFEDGTFRPRQVITRGQVASILAAASELDGVADGPFRDVAGSPHAGAINALVGAGVIEGYGDGTFGTQDRVQRAQAASLMVRWLGL